MTAGAFTCSLFLDCNPPPAPEDTTCDTAAPNGDDDFRAECKLTNGTNDAPPLEIIVDYGDGSGSNKWTRDYKQRLWAHSYSHPGEFEIFVRSRCTDWEEE